MADHDGETLEPDQQAQPQALTFDADVTARMLSLTDLQKKWCLARLRGANKTQAAREAGYQGDSEQLRQAGFRASQSGPVKRFLELAGLEGGGVADGPVDYDELKRILSKHARGSDKNSAINACNALAKIADKESEAERDRASNSNPVDVLVEIADLSDDCFTIALDLARKNNLSNEFETAWQRYVELQRTTPGLPNSTAVVLV